MADDHPKNLGGRPPLEFKDEYCEMLVNHMAEGLSFETFGAIVDCCKQTLYTWMEKYPQFLDARRRGDVKSQMYWEKLGNQHIINTSDSESQGQGYGWSKSRSINAAIYKLHMANKFGWREKTEVSSDQEKPLQITMNYERKKKKQVAE